MVLLLRKQNCGIWNSVGVRPQLKKFQTKARKITKLQMLAFKTSLKKKIRNRNKTQECVMLLLPDGKLTKSAEKNLRQRNIAQL